jgi:hypothetical protein
MRWTGVTRIDRFLITARLSDAISSAGGWVLDHHQFSNYALCLNFEIPAAQLGCLQSALTTTGVSFDVQGLPTESSEKMLAGTLHISFLHEDPPVPVELPIG